jgi:hypothetical protein
MPQLEKIPNDYHNKLKQFWNIKIFYIYTRCDTFSNVLNFEVNIINAVCR